MGDTDLVLVDVRRFATGDLLPAWRLIDSSRTLQEVVSGARRRARLPHSPGTDSDRRWFEMSESVTTFAERLTHFALSVDIVTDDTFDRVRDLVVDNMRNELEAAYFGLMEFTEVNGRPGLRTIWSSAGIDGSTTIVDDEEVYKQQVCLAFDQGLSLWVVEKGAGPLGPEAST